MKVNISKQVLQKWHLHRVAIWLDSSQDMRSP